MAYSIFTNRIPSSLDANAIDSDVTLGTQWYSEYDGAVQAIRFYLGTRAFDGYQLTAGLYKWSDGSLLAQKTYTVTGSDAIGWVEIILDQPVVVKRNEAHVAAVWFPGMQTLPDGRAHYAATSGFFTADAVDNPPLHAYKNDSTFTQKQNGVYVAGATLAYPTNTVGASYFIDVVFDYIMQVKVRSSGAWVDHPVRTRASGSWQL